MKTRMYEYLHNQITKLRFEVYHSQNMLHYML